MYIIEYITLFTQNKYVVGSKKTETRYERKKATEL